MRTHGLTAHQWRVARMVARADTDKDIATELAISLAGVDQLLARIAKVWKLDPSKNRRAQITSRVVRFGLETPAA